ncbi:MAG: class I SAM-dependent methyltransferase [Solirubrobacteraceae bacterium]
MVDFADLFNPRKRGMTPRAEELRGRKLTRHEQEAGQPWDASYHGGGAPWDIGGPQPAVVQLASAGVFVGAVLDAGCGTGDNALCIAARGGHVFGFDVAPTAVSIAREHAAAEGLDAEFAVADALDLGQLGHSFDTVLDCALFHALDAEERQTYVAGLRSVTNPGGRLYLLCFADSNTEPTGPHPVRQRELREPFEGAGGWKIESISRERLFARFAPDGLPAWLLIAGAAR